MTISGLIKLPYHVSKLAETERPLVCAYVDSSTGEQGHSVQLLVSTISDLAALATPFKRTLKTKKSLDNLLQGKDQNLVSSNTTHSAVLNTYFSNDELVSMLQVPATLCLNWNHAAAV